MIQFNLLPDVKYQYLKAKRLQHGMIGISVIAVAVCVLILIFLILFVDVFQKKHISDLTSDIKTNAAQIKSIDGLDQIITVQNQLETLPGLYEQNPQASRIFNYITQLTPPQVSIGDLSLDFTANTITIKGSAPALDNVNAFTDTLKAATYDDQVSGATGVAAFNGVTMSSYGRTTQGASYTIDANFDGDLFKSDETIVLHVPKTNNLPKVPSANDGSLFKALPKTQQQGGQ